MSRRALQSRRQVCQLCDFITTSRSPIRPSVQFPKSLYNLSQNRSLQSTQSQGAKPVQKTKMAPVTALKKPQSVPTAHATQAELTAALQQARASCNLILNLEKVPSEQETLQVLWQCEYLAKLILDYETPLPKKDAVSALLQLDQANKKTSLPKTPPPLEDMVNELSSLAYSILRHPPVFVSPKALEVYVSIQSSLRRPQSLPEAFHLYANKPLPKEGSSPIRYTKQNPNKVGNAIPISVADQALQAAIEAKQLTTAMDLIENSYSTTSFKRAKFVRKGLVPAIGLAVAPIAAYTVASQAALMQTTMDTQMATTVAFTGIVAYMGFTGTIGLVALTTANDQMERVTWTPGMPLKSRWIREEERAAIDRVAQAWGFNETWRRGEEEGLDWDALRDWAGQRGMLVDAAELLEGME